MLAVDDDPVVMATLQYVASDRFVLRTASSGAEALRILADSSETIAVLLADQRMPGMSGVALCGHARALRPDIVTLIMTAYYEIEITIEAIRRGDVSAYLAKPWTEHQLVAALQSGIAQAHAASAERAPEHQDAIGSSGREAAPSSREGSQRSWGPFRVDLRLDQVWVDEREIIGLPRSAMRLLDYLIVHAGRVCTHEELRRAALSGRAVNERYMARLIFLLRKRCGAAGKLIATHKGTGYRLAAREAHETRVGDADAARVARATRK